MRRLGLVMFIVFGLLAAEARADSWTLGPPTTQGRAYATATLLTNGKVLLAGGYTGTATASSELYDPATNTWTATPPMSVSRIEHTATRLPNGRVLVTGGGDNTGAGIRITAEIYKPATNKWAPAASMSIRRIHHTATLLPNGKVLVVGGYPAGTAAEIYDPATDTWAPAASMSTARFDHTTTLLPNGRVLVTGGTNGLPVATAELYDPATDSWSAVPNMSSKRSDHNATLLANGKVLVTGAYDPNQGETAVNSAELYDPAANTWAPVPDLSPSRQGHTATLLPSGRVLVVGGDPFPDSTAQLYDPATNAWLSAPPTKARRRYATATLLPNGSVLVVGGSLSPSTTELYTVGSGDSDADGTPDATDNCPSVSNPDQKNTDHDAQGDACDGDDDNDGVADAADAFPLDSTESVDSDGDGTGNNADTDDDNDGVPDADDESPTGGRVTLSPDAVTAHVGDTVTFHLTFQDVGPASTRQRSILVYRNGGKGKRTVKTRKATYQTDVSYVPAKAGPDTMTACYDRNESGTCDAGEARDTSTIDIAP